MSKVKTTAGPVTAAFHDTVLRFLTQLSSLLPEEPKLRTYVFMYETMRKTQPKKVISMITSKILPFQEQIMRKDEDFFINEQNLAGKLSELKSEGSLSSEIGLVSYWRELDELTKNTIWQYIQNICVLGAIITSN
jgi:hypothetical protein